MNDPQDIQPNEISPSPNDQESSSEIRLKSLDTPGRRFGIRGCIMVVGSFLLLGLASAYGYHQWFGEKVDPNLKTPEVAQSTSPESSEPEDELKGITAGLTKEAIKNAKHPLIPALEVARLGLENMEKTVFDYEAVIVKQALVKNKLTGLEHMKIKIRHARELEDGTKVPFSVYTRFLSPQNVVGQEAIYVDGWNNGKLVAHVKPGILNRLTFRLAPTSSLAMQGNIYPITMIGMKNLIKEMLEKGGRDLEHGECEVTFNRDIEIDGRKCVLVQITHPKERDHFEFHIAKIYIDEEYQLPVAYEGYLWPEEEGGEPRLLEKYFYTDLKINVGLEDSDFDPSNEEYDYPG